MASYQIRVTHMGSVPEIIYHETFYLQGDVEEKYVCWKSIHVSYICTFIFLAAYFWLMVDVDSIKNRGYSRAYRTHLLDFSLSLD